ncbi:UDP-N-acetylglucosamine 1-carboxyvinyltransferase [Streptomyces sp. Ncost-T6T-2b]|nr:UDP-N-acetylglucosamine 1-carboxyvinyltransferase [Streptomyces sp. Ncost-T6T-2b]
MTRGGVQTHSGALVRELRKGKGWSLATLAVQTGTNVNSLSRIERGTQAPGPDLLLRIAQALGTTTRALAPQEGAPTLRQIREWTGRTRAQVARELGVVPNTVGTAERGVTRPRDTGRWAAVYGLTPREFEQAWQRSREETSARAQRRDD